MCTHILHTLIFYMHSCDIFSRMYPVTNNSHTWNIAKYFHLPQYCYIVILFFTIRQPFPLVSLLIKSKSTIPRKILVWDNCWKLDIYIAFWMFNERPKQASWNLNSVLQYFLNQLKNHMCSLRYYYSRWSTYFGSSHECGN